jgi:hypothetical protein
MEERVRAHAKRASRLYNGRYREGQGGKLSKGEGKAGAQVCVSILQGGTYVDK